MFISLYFQTFWPKWLNFFRSFQKHIGLWPKKKQFENTLPTNAHSEMKRTGLRVPNAQHWCIELPLRPERTTETTTDIDSHLLRSCSTGTENAKRCRGRPSTRSLRIWTPAVCPMSRCWKQTGLPGKKLYDVHLQILSTVLCFLPPWNNAFAMLPSHTLAVSKNFRGTECKTLWHRSCSCD